MSDVGTAEDEKNAPIMTEITHVGDGKTEESVNITTTLSHSSDKIDDFPTINRAAKSPRPILIHVQSDELSSPQLSSSPPVSLLSPATILTSSADIEDRMPKRKMTSAASLYTFSASPRSTWADSSNSISNIGQATKYDTVRQELFRFPSSPETQKYGKSSSTDSCPVESNTIYTGASEGGEIVESETHEGEPHNPPMRIVDGLINVAPVQKDVNPPIDFYDGTRYESPKFDNQKNQNTNQMIVLEQESEDAGLISPVGHEEEEAGDEGLIKVPYRHSDDDFSFTEADTRYEQASKVVTDTDTPEEPALSSTARLREEEKLATRKFALEAEKRFLSFDDYCTRVPPEGLTIHCRLIRIRTALVGRRQQQFQLFTNYLCVACGGSGKRSRTEKCMICGGSGDALDIPPKYLLGARKRRRTKLPYYSITVDQNDPTCKESHGFVGKLHCSNVLFTRWDVSKRIIDASLADEEQNGPDEEDSFHYREQATFSYKNNPLGNLGPRQIFGDIQTGLGGKCGFSNKRPRWSEKSSKYLALRKVLGRVKQSSIKNFMLVANDDAKQENGEEIPIGAKMRLGAAKNSSTAMLFGKVNNNIFSLDFEAPMNMLTAFSIALTAFVEKPGSAFETLDSSFAIIEGGDSSFRPGGGCIELGGQGRPGGRQESSIVTTLPGMSEKFECYSHNFPVIWTGHVNPPQEGTIAIWLGYVGNTHLPGGGRGFFFFLQNFSSKREDGLLLSHQYDSVECASIHPSIPPFNKIPSFQRRAWQNNI
eukprot:UC4_evm8s74